jgi:putative ABC transport system permease protein
VTRWLERLALRLLPPGDRDRFGAELRHDWQVMRHQVRRERGRMAEWRYICREAWTFAVLLCDRRSRGRQHWSWSAVRQDGRAAVRRLMCRPVRSIALCLMLAAAFTATLVAFAVADAILWRDLPFRDPGRLVAVWEHTATASGGDASRITPSRFVDWADHASAFSSVAAFGAAGFQVEDGNSVTSVRGVRVSGHFFELLGVAPVAGRLLTRADQEAGAPPVVVLSHDYWRTRYAGRTSAVGETLRLSGRAYTVVGVLPDIWLPAWPVNPATIQLDREHRQLWVPLAPVSTLAQNRNSHLLGAIGRLADGVSVDAATEQLTAMAAPGNPDPHGGVVRSLRSQMVQQTRGPLLILLAAACCVLLVAALNLAAIDLASFESRLTEFRVRAALGASAGALSRQLFAESLPVVVASALLATGASHAALVLVASQLSNRLPLMTTPRLDSVALVVLAGLAVLVAVVMTAWPVLRARSFSRLRDRGEARVIGVRPGVFRALIVGQLSGAVALVLVSTVLVQSFMAIGARDPGFDPTDVHMMEISLPRDRYRSPEAIVATGRLLRERLAALPGARAATLSHDHPFEANWLDVVTVRGRVDGTDGDAGSQAQLRIVDPGYVEAMRAHLVDGYGFDSLLAPSDDGVVLVNEAFVQRERVSVGQALTLSSPSGTWGNVVPSTFTIAGVVGDERFRGLEADSEPAVYVSTHQFPQTDLTLLVRFAPGTAPDAAAFRAAVRNVESRASLGVVKPLVDVEAAQRAPRTLMTALIGSFASGALVLAATGLYGMLSLMVAARQRDIGVRLALGASPRRIRRQVIADGFLPVVTGVVFGVGLALLTSTALSAFLVDVTLLAPATLTITIVMVAGIALAASIGPAFRASRTDPTVMLRR